VADLPRAHWPMSLPRLCREAHRTAIEKGWWGHTAKRTLETQDEVLPSEYDARSVGELLALIHSELSEALEEWRDGYDLTAIRIEDGKPEGFPVELADALIRVADLCGRYRIDLDRAVRVKLAYNRTRPHRHGEKKA